MSAIKPHSDIILLVLEEAEEKILRLTGWKVHLMISSHKDALTVRLYKRFLKDFNINLTREREHVIKRQVLAYALKKRNYGITSIGRIMGVDHSTIFHSIKVIQNALGSLDDGYKNSVKKELADVEEFLNKEMN